MQLPGLENWKIKIDSKDLKDVKVGRIYSVNKNNCNVYYDDKILKGELTGKLLYSMDSEESSPAVGDFVNIEVYDELAIIKDILPRFSILKRKTTGKKIEFQLIASNIDIAFIIQSIDSDFNLNRLERYLAMIYEAKIEPVVIFTKADLISKEEISEKLIQIEKRNPGIKTICLSNYNFEDIEKFKSTLKRERTYCLLGSSGVGKSTLLNNLLGFEHMATNDVRKSDSKGKHTTTRREIIVLQNGSIFVDTPGMKELGNISINDGLLNTFFDIDELITNCKFSNCNHISDDGCAVLAAIEDGSLDKERYDNFIKMKKESEYYGSSYIEKRKKDKAFGKMVKSIMAEKNSKLNK